MRYYVTVKVSCPECRGSGQISTLCLAPQRSMATGMCLSCDGTGELRVDAPFTDALASALDSRAQAAQERDQNK